MKVKVVDKILPMTLHDIVRFQINNYCFLEDVRVSPAQLDTLAYLGVWGDINISDFCDQVVEEQVFTNAQTVRNFIVKCVKNDLVIRKGTGKKIICLSDEFGLQRNGSILINMKVYHEDKGEESNNKDS